MFFRLKTDLTIVNSLKRKIVLVHIINNFYVALTNNCRVYITQLFQFNLTGTCRRSGVRSDDQDNIYLQAPMQVIYLKTYTPIKHYPIRNFIL